MRGPHKGCFLGIVLWVAFVPAHAQAQGNGKLQIHVLDVGQGSAAVLISPEGQVVMIDNGPSASCDSSIAYLQSLGVTTIAVHIASHYHADHIGCTDKLLAAFPLQGQALDRGGSYSSQTFTRYRDAVGAARTTATTSTTITLDPEERLPVVMRVVAVNANGVSVSDENDKGVVLVVEHGGFRAEFGGDLPGAREDGHQDIESIVAPLVGRLDFYLVHHHGSKTSTSEEWLAMTHPQVAVLSVGPNSYGHPSPEALNRLYEAGVRTYWTSAGDGAAELGPLDSIAGTTIVEVLPGAWDFSVTSTASWTTESFSIPRPIRRRLTRVWSEPSQSHGVGPSRAFEPSDSPQGAGQVAGL